MKKYYIFSLIFLCLGSGLMAQKNISKIAFGSCARNQHPLEIFDVVLKHQPDMFIFLGDNIYGDTNDMDSLQAQYNTLGLKPTYQNLRKKVPHIYATWDDHDYGDNDIGRHYPHKEASKKIFLDFFKEPADSPRRKNQGVHTSYMHQYKDKKVQIILLDVRTFRDDLKDYDKTKPKDKRFFYNLDFTPHSTADSTMLGQKQWQWLENELRQPADLRIIGTGTQFGIEYNGYEAWANFPAEQQKMYNLIEKTKANGVLFISGDVHYAEISKIKPSNTYPIYDVTSSGLSATWKFATPNSNRIEGPIMENNFGLITVDWQQKKPQVKMEIWDKTDNQRIEYSIDLKELSFPKKCKKPLTKWLSFPLQSPLDLYYNFL